MGTNIINPLFEDGRNLAGCGFANVVAFDLFEEVVNHIPATERPQQHFRFIHPKLVEREGFIGDGIIQHSLLVNPLVVLPTIQLARLSTRDGRTEDHDYEKVCRNSVLSDIACYRL